MDVNFDMQEESQDYIKRQQLRELAMLNSNFREESPGPSGSVSPFNSSGMKRAKTGRWKLSLVDGLDDEYCGPPAIGCWEYLPVHVSFSASYERIC